MDHVAFPLAIGVLATAVGTVYGLLPERIDATFVFAAYGVGAIMGDAVGARRPEPDSATYSRRWGGAMMALAGLYWAILLVLQEVR